MDRTSIASKFKEIVANYMELGMETISDSSISFLELGVDSLDSVEILMETEKQFDIVTTSDEIESIKTVEEAIDLIVKKIDEKG
ncbi:MULTISPECIES: acyl carrier protein [unclassified Pseudomonas]|uniref:acyl carrier protein n=1 Tax=unclassified Pseudomonas TaxID=196821 RepID=UPI002B228895|nr:MULTISPECIES: acyl carrier protein [unclassified Pseudomonas]MEA9975668.1 acyl carrier protein [Pseudomonas sp. RTS4]MEB0198869.1 acyl carrier protein [Pseudomonas sp. 5S4]MEB0245056.1 acyl carrier protein [Pseudomonas sp. 10S5]